MAKFQINPILRKDNQKQVNECIFSCQEVFDVLS